MVLTYEETEKLENLKHNHEIELLKIKEEQYEREHKRKVERLNIQLEIAKATGKVVEE